jgi:hypothetical protein
MVAYKYHGPALGYIFFAFGTNAEKGHRKKDVAPDLIEKSHPAFNFFYSNAEKEKRK